MMNSSALTISRLLTPQRVILDLKSSDRESVLEELVDAISELAGEPQARQTLLKALHERERLHSTGIGDGIALPHARNALVGLIDHPLVVFGRHHAGIPYEAIDQIPARLFFLIVAPTVTQHLGILARLSRLLRDPRLRKRLLEAKDAAQVQAAVHEAESSL